MANNVLARLGTRALFKGHRANGVAVAGATRGLMGGVAVMGKKMVTRYGFVSFLLLKTC